VIGVLILGVFYEVVVGEAVQQVCVVLVFWVPHRMIPSILFIKYFIYLICDMGIYKSLDIRCLKYICHINGAY